MKLKPQIASSKYTFTFCSEDKNSVMIEYDQPIAFNSYGEISGFYICYKKSHECDKGGTVKDWKYIGQLRLC